MDKDMEKIVASIKFYWERWVDNSCRAADLQELGNSNWIYSHEAARGYKADFNNAFRQLTEKLEELDDGRNAYDILDTYDCLRSRSGDRNLSA